VELFALLVLIGALIPLWFFPAMALKLFMRSAIALKGRLAL
jgi:hypothetical protein